MIEIARVVPQCDICPIGVDLWDYSGARYHAWNRHGVARLWRMADDEGHEFADDAPLFESPRADDGYMSEFLAWMEAEPQRWIRLTAWPGTWA